MAEELSNIKIRRVAKAATLRYLVLGSPIQVTSLRKKDANGSLYGKE
jgi:hypothetical protein